MDEENDNFDINNMQLSFIQNILNEFQNSEFNMHSNGNRFVVEFEFNLENIHPNLENLPNYFKNVKHINEKLGKPIYINKKDHICGEDCLICLEKFNNKKYKRVLPCCNNTFHKTCIDKWFKKNSTCPACRHDFLEKKENN